MSRRLFVLAIAGLLASPALAQGQRGQRQRGERGQRGGFRLQDPFARAIDADKDGTLSADEIASASKRLMTLDGDGNGSIDLTEIRDAVRAGMRGSGRGSRGGGPGSAGASTLERTGLKVGQSLPDITIHNEKGGNFRMADVKGKHTVIVFGCLT